MLRIKTIFKKKNSLIDLQYSDTSNIYKIKIDKNTLENYMLQKLYILY